MPVHDSPGAGGQPPLRITPELLAAHNAELERSERDRDQHRRETLHQAIRRNPGALWFMFVDPDFNGGSSMPLERNGREFLNGVMARPQQQFMRASELNIHDEAFLSLYLSDAVDSFQLEHATMHLPEYVRRAREAKVRFDRLAQTAAEVDTALMRGREPCPAVVKMPRTRRQVRADELAAVFRGKQLEIRAHVRASFAGDVAATLDEATGGNLKSLLTDKSSPYRETAFKLVMAMTPQIVSNAIASALPIFGLIWDAGQIISNLWEAGKTHHLAQKVNRWVPGLMIEARHCRDSIYSNLKAKRNGLLQDVAIDTGSFVAKLSGLCLDLSIFTGPITAACQAVAHLALAVHEMEELLEEQKEINRALLVGIEYRQLSQYALLASYAVENMKPEWFFQNAPGSKSQAVQWLQDVSFAAKQILDDSPFCFYPE